MHWDELARRPGRRGRPDRQAVIEQVMAYVRDHPQSFASLAVCRRALGSEPGGEVDPQTRARLQARLQSAPDDELEAYYYIIS